MFVGIPKCASPALQRLAEQRLGIRPSALRDEERAEVVHRHDRVRVVPAQRALAPLERLAQEALALVVLLQFAQQRPKSVECDERFAMIATELGTAQTQRLAIELDGVGGPPL